MRITTIFLAMILLACAEPRDTFDDFSRRVNDAGVQTSPDAQELDEIPDISGEFYMVMQPSRVDVFFRFIMTTSIEPTANGAILDISMQPLHAETREPVGDALISDDNMVANTGEFTAEFAGTIPGDANAASSRDVTAEIEMLGIVRTEDLFCGDIDGQVTEPILLALDGSTFGAVRIESGTTGDDLPDDLFACPGGEQPDAGPTDAGVPDAQ